MQDIVEQPFAHIRQGLGSHRDPTKAQAVGQSVVGDVIRGINGEGRRNASYNVRRMSELQVTGVAPQLMFAVTQSAQEAADPAWDTNSPAEVVRPRIRPCNI